MVEVPETVVRGTSPFEGIGQPLEGLAAHGISLGSGRRSSGCNKGQYQRHFLLIYAASRELASDPKHRVGIPWVPASLGLKLRW